MLIAKYRDEFNKFWDGPGDGSEPTDSETRSSKSVNSRNPTLLGADERQANGSYSNLSSSPDRTTSTRDEVLTTFNDVQDPDSNREEST